MASEGTPNSNAVWPFVSTKRFLPSGEKLRAVMEWAKQIIDLLHALQVLDEQMARPLARQKRLRNLAWRLTPVL